MTAKNKIRSLLKKFSIKHSISARLALYIMLAIIGVFIALFFVFLPGSGRIVEEEAIRHANSELSAIVCQIEGILNQVQTATRNMEWAVEQNLDQPDSLHNITRRMVHSNPLIIGSSIAFKTSYYPQKGKAFAPYSCLTDDGSIADLQLGTETYDYFSKEWFNYPMQENQDHWCEPYFDKGGGDSIMTTFSRLLRNPQGEAFGILTADISLHHLTDILNQTKPYPHSYTLMISRNGTYLAHPLQARILYDNIDSVMTDMQDTTVRSLGDAMKSGEQGMQKLLNKNVSSYVFYKPVPTTGWSVAIVCPSKEVFASLDETIRLVFIVFIIGLVLLLIFCLWIIRHTIHPLSHVTEAVRRVADGELHAPLPQIDTKDEIGQLLTSFRHMQLSLDDYIHRLTEITSAKERFENELRIARHIQMAMLPKIFPPFPDRKNLDLYAILQPAREVGGDLYDFFIRDEKLFFTIGDVSGKGIPASLFMAITRSLFRMVAANTDSPAKIANALNNSVAESNEANMFVTMYIGVIDLETGTMTFCNAGHNPPILLYPDGNCEFQKVQPNLPVGAVEGIEYEDQTIDLPYGTALLLYTDGMNEAENTKHEQFGNERLIQHVKQSCHYTSQETVKHLQQQVTLFAGDAEQSDDLTLLCIRLDGSSLETKETGKKEILRKMNDKTLQIKNKIEELKRLPSFLHDIQGELSLPDSLTDSLNLVLEEAMVNVIQYAYPVGEAGDVSLAAHWNAGTQTLTFTLKDSGKPFDPTAVPDVDTTLSLEERPIGGLGIFLIRQIMDKVEYSYDKGYNILIMSKNIG